MATFRNPKIRPHVQPPDIEAIPAYVRQFPHWVLWRFDWNQSSSARAKVPYHARTLSHAKCNDPSSWSTFEAAEQAYREHAGFDGLGFMFSVADSILRLYQGRTDDYAGDDSAADLALCSKLAFWSDGDPSLLDAMFRGFC